ncbi:beta-phosphoglucomutase [Levilactobacillus bambusae]|uniref:Beta-phosphoglucomutase n=1 Tax=Levilactobacillus bambusae TaxID=2024736 RepID=A0A2V1N6L2_9LACO|nr:beta-phosphoglucomutase [Levilactobacillus bambusae]PWG01080.1 beta-phosphoglucomutase [Levilactobacillus bambusae]
MVQFSDIKGFVFDLDGVITDTSALHSKAWHKTADEVGVTWTTELDNGLKGISRMDSLNMILAAGNKENDYTQAEKEKLADEKNDYYIQLVDAMTAADILPGIQSFLDSLVENHYQISLASASKNAPRVLDKLGLSDYFKKIVNPADLTKGKPDPEIYTKGAELLKLPPEACIGIEDAEAGIDSINAAGETSVGLGDKAILKDADMVFATSRELTLGHIADNME